MKHPSFTYLLPLAALTACQQSAKDQVESLADIKFEEPPNILWLSIEDLDCTLPVYGDSTAPTPNIDRLASEGVVFDNAYTVSGVCAPSRSSIISGMYPTRMGTHNMRTSGITPPEEMRCFSSYLRDAGYYCTNNRKEDYNFNAPDGTWDESSVFAHYRNRPEDKPFFAVFNQAITHESRIWTLSWGQLLVDPAKVPVPEYYPDDNMTIRRDIARKYSNITLMDYQIGLFVEDLEKKGLLDNTIIVVWGDHGGMLPRQKRAMYNSGIKVPLVIRFPNKLMAGQRIEEPVSLMDLGPTMMSLAGLQKPEHMDGKVFIGPERDEPRKYIYAARDRMDAQYDMRRAVCDGHFKYIRSFYPEKPFKQVNQYRLQISMMRELNSLHKEGKLHGNPKIWYLPSKPVEELYDTKADPDEVNNLANDEAYKEKLLEMRNAYFDWQKNTLDLGLLPEQCMFNLQEKHDMPVYNYLERNPVYYEKVCEAANNSLYPEENASFLEKALTDSIPAVRFWAVRGIGRLKAEGMKYAKEIMALENDPSSAVRACAAWTLCTIGKKEAGKKIFRQLFVDAPRYGKIMAVNFAGDMGKEAASLKADLEYLEKHGEHYISRAASSALIKINGSILINN